MSTEVLFCFPTEDEAGVPVAVLHISSCVTYTAARPSSAADQLRTLRLGVDWPCLEGLLYEVAKSKARDCMSFHTAELPRTADRRWQRKAALFPLCVF